MLTLTLDQYNKLFDLLIIIIRGEGDPELKKAAKRLLGGLKKPQPRTPMTDEEIREYYREVFGYPNG